MSARARRVWRRGLRATRNDPLALLTYVMHFYDHEKYLPGMKKFRGE